MCLPRALLAASSQYHYRTLLLLLYVVIAQDYEAGKPPANSIALAGAMLHKSQDPDNTSDWRNSCFEIHSSDLLRSKRNKEGRLYFKATSGG
jgi:hypothetical protein